MSRIYVSLVGAICLTSASIGDSARAVTFNYTNPQSGSSFTVVEADPFLSGGSPGNTVNMNNPGQFFADVSTGAPPFYNEGLYRWRDFGIDVNVPPAVPSDPDVFEVTAQVVPPPDLRTTISGLPNATYDVYLAFTVEGNRPDNPIAPGTLAADLDVGQAKPTTLRGGRSQLGLILTGLPSCSSTGCYEFALAPLGQVTGTQIKVLVGPMWAGDVSDDYKNDGDDISIVLSHFGQPVTPGDRTMGDTDGNGFITASDLTNVSYEAWGITGYPPGRRGDYVGVAYKLSGTGSGSALGIVPEPSAIGLFVIGWIVLLSSSCRHAKRVLVMVVPVFVAAMSPSAALAAISGTFVQITSEEGVSPPTNRVSQDLQVTATTDWLQSEILLTLSPAGSLIYQDFNAGSPSPVYAPPNPSNFGTFPTLRYDTYLTGSSGVAGGAPNSAGAAVDIGGVNNISSGGTFNSQKVDEEWYTLSSSDVGTFTLGRFTLTNTAQGTWALRLDAAESNAPYFSKVLSGGLIQNGLLIAAVPGDYNGNGKVDAADYVLWRKGGPLLNEVDTPGTVNAADYAVWRTRSGNVSGSGSGTLGGSAVPEPAAAALLAGGLVAVLINRHLLGSTRKSFR